MNRSWTQYEGQVVAEQFCLRQFLGASGQGAVFLTERSGTDSQKAAIKLLPAESVDAEGQLSRWISASPLSHPHLLQIFRTGRCRLDNAEFLYAVTEYAEENLAQIILQRPLSADEARDMLDPVLDALLYLHGKGFVHGGIKPANIMAAGDKVKISSDSIRLAGSSGTTANIGASNISAPSISAPISDYDPPERVTAGFSQAGDVWSLSMALVEVLTQHLPVWNSADQGEPQLPESSLVPQPFLDIVRNSLVRDPARRWTLGEIAARLQPNYQPTVSATDSSLSAIQTPSRAQQNLQRRESRQPKHSRAASPRYIIPGVAAALVFAALVIPKFFHQHSAQRSGEAEAAAAQLPVPAPVKARAKINSQSAALPAAKLTRPTTKSNAIAATSTPVPTALRTEEKKSPGVNPVRGAVLHEVLPDVSSKARDTIHGTVKISVRTHVNPAGAVTAADLSGVAPSKYFADLALKASREWTFQSPESAGHSLSSEWVLHYYFTPSSTRAVPEQLAP
jgi:serine/threonine protein kinase